MAIKSCRSWRKVLCLQRRVFLQGVLCRRVFWLLLLQSCKCAHGGQCACDLSSSWHHIICTKSACTCLCIHHLQVLDLPDLNPDFANRYCFTLKYAIALLTDGFQFPGDSVVDFRANVSDWVHGVWFWCHSDVYGFRHFFVRVPVLIGNSCFCGPYDN